MKDISEDISEVIKKYPKIFKDYEGNPYRVNWHCPTGWLKTLDFLCGTIQSYTDNINEHNTHLEPIQQVECTQVKEKFAGLRFYFNGGNDAIEGMVDMAEHICWRTCQDCGSQEDVEVVRGGWWVTLCKSCREEKNG